MKLTIDRDKKTIKLEGLINLDEFTKVLDEMFPGGTWLEYSLDFRCEKDCCTKSKSNWSYGDWLQICKYGISDANKNSDKPFEVFCGSSTSTGGYVQPTTTADLKGHTGSVTLTAQ